MEEATKCLFRSRKSSVRRAVEIGNCAASAALKSRYSWRLLVKMCTWFSRVLMFRFAEYLQWRRDWFYWSARAVLQVWRPSATPNVVTHVGSHRQQIRHSSSWRSVCSFHSISNYLHFLCSTVLYTREDFFRQMGDERCFVWWYRRQNLLNRVDSTHTVSESDRVGVCALIHQLPLYQQDLSALHLKMKNQGRCWKTMRECYYWDILLIVWKVNN